MRTIRRQLLLGLLCAMLACAGGASLLLYRSLLHEIDELADLQLRQLAAALPNEFAPNSALPAAEDPEEEFVLQAWRADGTTLYASQNHGLLPRYAADGFVYQHWHGGQWRIYGTTRQGRYIQVAQPMAARDKLAAAMAWRASLPLLLFVVLLTALIMAVVARALRPLDQLASAVAGRSPNALQPVAADGMPPELLPIVQALNGLLEKFDTALTAQRRFVADAAHELRSPLTALKLQLQLLERAGDEGARKLALGKLHERLDRSTHLVKQLLSLARHEASAAAQWQSIDLHQLLRTALADHGALADSRAIDLGIEPAGDAAAATADAPRHGTPPPVLVRADQDGLQVLLNNLVDNALRYTQPGGRVDLTAGVTQGRAFLQVSDNGPGVPEQYRDRLFDRFFRPEGMVVWGCGLGLSIVHNIAEQHLAEIELDAAHGERGLRVTLRFPAQRDARRAGIAA